MILKMKIQTEPFTMMMKDKLWIHISCGYTLVIAQSIIVNCITMGEILHFVFFHPKIMNTNYIALTLHIPFILNSYAIGARCSCVQLYEQTKVQYCTSPSCVLLVHWQSIYHMTYSSCPSLRLLLRSSLMNGLKCQNETGL